MYVCMICIIIKLIFNLRQLICNLIKHALESLCDLKKKITIVRRLLIACCWFLWTFSSKKNFPFPTLYFFTKLRYFLSYMLKRANRWIGRENLRSTSLRSAPSHFETLRVGWRKLTQLFVVGSNLQPSRLQSDRRDLNKNLWKLFNLFHWNLIMGP